ncbi:5-oxoprolinase subunit PxpB [Halarcobacter bivalviorum]|uniref:Allophanate hydrolase n=1 Tax=Halarcobacter bivalviorum TaxID=663364 RepID=A0AAX2A9F5_9BACT|nr:5-oxoprolinase subunit PxpB [Halarcobacter bivalviorum]AXH11795.1 allophanate hydrolase, subunit 1 [Halarcobacter bivalviorum]RXK10922.1 allophanate hydrolase [Halarcobacter bivalviorum]
MEIKVASVDSVIIYFDNNISKEISNKVKASYAYLKSLNNEAFIDIIPSYSSILITYELLKYDFESIKKYLEEELKNVKVDDDTNSKLVEIDVYYGEEVGFDLQRVASINKLTIEEVINLHSSKVYDVYTIGFLPGFAYLGVLDEKIATKRLETPRKKIPKGSVSIADTQTAVYPKDSPGGWNIIGKTTFEFFDKNLEALSQIDINTKIKFNQISKEEFLKQGGII